jgi:acyl CoA:acetate/3-ketoacid CoA transferase
LIERIRAGGFGLGGILTQTGVGTPVQDEKQAVEVDGKSFLVETALRADFALVQAFVADYLGNLGYALTARNFNPVIAMAADAVIVNADNIVPVGVISPDQVMTPATVVDYLVVNHDGPDGTPDHHRAAHCPGAQDRHACQSGRWNPDIGGKLCSQRAACLLPIRKWADRDRRSTPGRHGASHAHGCRRPTRHRPAWRLRV